MNMSTLLERNSRDQVARWWNGAVPVLRRLAPRWGVCLLLLGGLWLAAAHYDARYDSLTPQIGVKRIPLPEYVKRGQDIPAEENAAVIYREAAELLNDPGNWKSDSAEAFRLYNFLHSGFFKMPPANWQILEAFADETEGVAAKMRGAAQRPKCVFPFKRDRYGYIQWGLSSPLWQLLGIRARVAVHRGDAAAWHSATNDMLLLLETSAKDRSPEAVGLDQEILHGLLETMEEACASGIAGDDAFLNGMDARLAALRPMEAFEPLLRLAWSTMDFRHTMQYYQVYPYYIPEKAAMGLSIYPEHLDVPYRAGGFAARDRFLCAAYLSRLLNIARSGQPQRPERAWAWIAGQSRNVERTAAFGPPRYYSLCRETAYGGRWGAPGTLYGNLADICMTRAVIAVMLQGRDENGHFRDQEFLKTLIAPYPCPMTGEPMRCIATPDECNLSYRARTGRWGYQDYWELRVRLEVPAAEKH